MSTCIHVRRMKRHDGSVDSTYASSTRTFAPIICASSSKSARIILSSLFTSTPSRQRKRRWSSSGTLRTDVTPRPVKTGCVMGSPDDDSIGKALSLALLLDRRNLTIRLTTSGSRSGNDFVGERARGSAFGASGDCGGEESEAIICTIRR